MNRDEWLKVRNFAPSEFADADRMDYDFVKQLDAFRAKLGERILINFSNGPERHAPGSLHPQGKAADVMLERAVTFDDFLLATRFFTEVGVYPDWRRQGNPKAKGGLHVGYERFAVSFAMQRKYWIGVKDDGGKTAYEALNLKSLKRLRLA